MRYPCRMTTRSALLAAAESIARRSRRAPLAPLRFPRRLGLGLANRADLTLCSLGRALAALPRAVDRPPQRLMRGLAGQKHAANRLHQDFSRGLSAWYRGRHRAEREGRGVPARR